MKRYFNQVIYILNVMVIGLWSLPANSAWIDSVEFYRLDADGSETHGGDGYMLLFDRARDIASAYVAQLDVSSLPSNTDPAVKDWIETNQKDYGVDVEQAPHVWAERPDQEYCAVTSLHSTAKILFSLVACRSSIHSIEDAVALLLHESVHHFEIIDEKFASDIAIAIIDAYKVTKHRGVGLWNEFRPKVQPCAPGRGSESFYTLIPFKDRNYAFSTIDNGNVLELCAGYFEPNSQDWKLISVPNFPNFSNWFVTVIGDQLMITYFFRSNQSQPKIGFFSYDPVLDRWKNVLTADAPSFEFRSPMVQDNSRIIFYSNVPGDQDPGYIFDLTNQSWNKIERPSASSNCELQYVIGTAGTLYSYKIVSPDQSSRFTSICKYDPDQASWTMLPTIVPAEFIADSSFDRPFATERYLLFPTPYKLFMFDTLSEKVVVTTLPYPLFQKNMIVPIGGDYLMAWSDSPDGPIGLLYHYKTMRWSITAKPLFRRYYSVMWAGDRLITLEKGRYPGTGKMVEFYPLQ